MSIKAYTPKDENNIIDIAETGVGYISIGAITKNISAIDLSLRFT